MLSKVYSDYLLRILGQALLNFLNARIGLTKELCIFTGKWLIATLNNEEINLPENQLNQIAISLAKTALQYITNSPAELKTGRALHAHHPSLLLTHVYNTILMDPTQRAKDVQKNISELIIKIVSDSETCYKFINVLNNYLEKCGHIVILPANVHHLDTHKILSQIDRINSDMIEHPESYVDSNSEFVSYLKPILKINQALFQATLTVLEPFEISGALQGKDIKDSMAEFEQAKNEEDVFESVKYIFSLIENKLKKFILCFDEEFINFYTKNLEVIYKLFDTYLTSHENPTETRTAEIRDELSYKNFCIENTIELLQSITELYEKNNSQLSTMPKFTELANSFLEKKQTWTAYLQDIKKDIKTLESMHEAIENGFSAPIPSGELLKKVAAYFFPFMNKQKALVQALPPIEMPNSESITSLWQKILAARTPKFIHRVKGILAEHIASYQAHISLIPAVKEKIEALTDEHTQFCLKLYEEISPSDIPLIAFFLNRQKTELARQSQILTERHAGLSEFIENLKKLQTHCQWLITKEEQKTSTSNLPQSWNLLSKDSLPATLASAAALPLDQADPPQSLEYQG